MTKLTNRIALEVAINAIENSTLPNWSCGDLSISKADAIDKLSGMIEQLDKKSGASKKPTKTQTENEALKERILEILDYTGKRATEIATEVGLSSGQKASALLSQMVKDGTVIRLEGEKRVTLFALPTVAE